MLGYLKVFKGYFKGICSPRAVDERTQVVNGRPPAEQKDLPDANKHGLALGRAQMTKIPVSKAASTGDTPAKQQLMPAHDEDRPDEN